ncbi:hypothetical protein J2X32_000514 [Rheinheimera pacifica]|nr:hypothetical protein [Rheinheimera pacifica]MDR6981906.1 hypothetical protein [Rheinheimera pacifica]PKM18846.1 MAG: DUF2474 domain-containing protein [Gammaproteobacteria bacterium HGW-Gammaproteobacteria-15]
MVKPALPNRRPLPKIVWFILLYLVGLGSLTLVALVLKSLLSGL